MNKQTLGTDTIHRHSFGQKKTQTTESGFYQIYYFNQTSYEKGVV